MQRTDYAGWTNCIRLANAEIELIATADVGPRVIRFGFIGGPNEFWECKPHLGQTGGDTWRIFGGHRLWHAPEHMPRSYMADNEPVRVEALPSGGVRLAPQVEPDTKIAKELELHLDPKANRVTATHRLRNEGLWPIELAPWALSVMAAGGTCVIPFPPRGPHPEHLLPASTLTLWKYTDLADPRYTFGTSSLLLRQDAARPKPQKIGAWNPEGWIAYANHGHAFVKRFPHVEGAPYPDRGANCEAFANGQMLEVETLGPLTKLAPGEAAVHVETWSLHRGVEAPRNDAEVAARILPLLAQS
ncbi:MAG: DUF4380 domain-containing protein [Planctomycetota bacterium]|nr:DUF4380 domain-containing protein [Planctomycetota bacterium]